jgi:hypothetical protein
MKPWLGWIVVLIGMGVVFGPTTPLSCPASVSAAQPKTAPGGAAKKKEEPKIEGQEIARGEAGFLGVEVVEGKFKLNFYDKEKKPMKPDVARAALRWDPKYKVGMERLTLSSAGESWLTSERVIRPPYNFKLFIVLVKDTSAGEDPVGETYTIDLRQ